MEVFTFHESPRRAHGIAAQGEANFSDHGTNRLVANYTLEADVDDYFIAPRMVMNFLPSEKPIQSLSSPNSVNLMKETENKIAKPLSIQWNTTAEEFHKALGKVLHTKSVHSRRRSELLEAQQELKVLQESIYKDLILSGSSDVFNFELEKSGQVEDYLDLAQPIVEDALQRGESFVTHFSVKHLKNEQEAK